MVGQAGGIGPAVGIGKAACAEGLRLRRRLHRTAIVPGLLIEPYDRAGSRPGQRFCRPDRIGGAAADDRDAPHAECDGRRSTPARGSAPQPASNSRSDQVPHRDSLRQLGKPMVCDAFLLGRIRPCMVRPPSAAPDSTASAERARPQLVDIFDEVDEELLRRTRPGAAQEVWRRHRRRGPADCGRRCRLAGLALVSGSAGPGCGGGIPDRDDPGRAYRRRQQRGQPVRRWSANSTGWTASAPEGYRTLARLRAAALKRRRRRRQGRPRCGTRSPVTARPIRCCATLASLKLWAQHPIGSADPALLEAWLKALAAPDNPWHLAGR